MESIKRRNRKRKIIELLESRGTMDVDTLAKELGISPITLRGDLKDLEKQSLIVRVWGGATLATHTIPEPPFEDRNVENLQEKRAIARAALTLIKPGDVIGLGGGTTAYELAKLLGNIPNIQVVTNAINIAYLLLRLGVRIVVPGGFSREGSYNLVGDRAEESLKGIFIDKLFVGADGVDIDGGITTLNPGEARFNSTMLNSAHTVIILADHGKIGHKRLIPISPIGRVHILITDEGAPGEILKKMEKKGVRVEIASLSAQNGSYSQSDYKFK